MALEQLDALAIEGSARAIAAFSNIADEAEKYSEIMFQSYVGAVGEADPSDFADETRDQGIQRYTVPANLRQAP